MRCQDLSTCFADYVSGEMPVAQAEEIRRHLDGCDGCRAEVESLAAMWNALGQLAEEEPSAALGGRFYTLLDAYQEGMAAGRMSWSERAAEWLAGWWPDKPAVQLAVTAAALVLGVVIGARFMPAGGEMAALQTEVASLNRLVSLSLLAQDSASDRLRGVSYGRRAADGEVLAALVGVLNKDDNVNVRLAAVDALARFADRRPVADELRAALPEQSSPLVQLALADLLLEVDGPETRRVVRELLQRDDLDETVRRHITQRLSPQA